LLKFDIQVIHQEAKNTKKIYLGIIVFTFLDITVKLIQSLQRYKQGNNVLSILISSNIANDFSLELTIINIFEIIEFS
jgi:hypothetical protein